MYAVKEVTASISDMGEVAARLGSIVTYDKRGDVVEFDNFEEPVLRWSPFSPGTGYIRLSSDYHAIKSGSQGLELKTDAAAGSNAYMLKNLAVLGSRRLGLELSCNPGNVDLILHLQMDYNMEGKRYVAYTDFNIETGIVRLQTPDGLIEIEEIPAAGMMSNLWHTVKLVVDVDTGYYQRFLFDSSEYDISDRAIYSPDPGAFNLVVVEIGIENIPAAAATCYVDNYVLTMLEP